MNVSRIHNPNQQGHTTTQVGRQHLTDREDTFLPTGKPHGERTANPFFQPSDRQGARKNFFTIKQL